MVLAEPWTFLRFCHPQSGQFFLLWHFSFPLSVLLDPLERCVWPRADTPIGLRKSIASEIRIRAKAKAGR